MWSGSPELTEALGRVGALMWISVWDGIRNYRRKDECGSAAENLNFGAQWDLIYEVDGGDRIWMVVERSTSIVGRTTHAMDQWGGSGLLEGGLCKTGGMWIEFRPNAGGELSDFRCEKEPWVRSGGLREKLATAWTIGELVCKGIRALRTGL